MKFEFLTRLYENLEMADISDEIKLSVIFENYHDFCKTNGHSPVEDIIVF